MPTLATNTRVRLSLLWVFVMLNMVFADILSFMSAGVLRISSREGQGRSSSPPASCCSPL